MAQLDLPPGLMPSLMDRLRDPESMGTREQPGYTLTQILDSVREDLEDLLNTRRSFQVTGPHFTELARSVVTYGLLDLSSVGGSSPGKQEIGRMIEKAIALHEPRLRNIRAKVIRSRAIEMRVRFQIDAELRVDPAPAVAFETVVELTTGHVSINEGGRMIDTLFPYYERELIFIRQFAQDFARQYPAAAARLRLDPTQSTDPHIERLIESFALLAGRIHHKLDDEFPELTDALLGQLYPHFLAPVPSMAIVQFELDAERAALPDGFHIERHSHLSTTQLGEGPCKYRTGYPVTLWPIAITSAELLTPPFPAGLQPPARTASALSLRLECQGSLKLADLSLDRLRFFLSGENHIIARVYGLLFNNATQVVFRSANSSLPTITLAPSKCLFQVGFGNDEILLPYPRRSFPGYCLLTELFAFPSKFQFLDLGGFQQLRQAGYEKEVEVAIFFNQPVGSLQQAVDAQTFRLGCTPVVNLFEQTAEPIDVTQRRYEYRIVPDVARPLSTEVYSVDSVTSIDPVTSKVTEYQPFYSFRHGVFRDSQHAFWFAARRPAPDDKDRGSDVYLTLVDLAFNPGQPGGNTLVVRTTCTNRNLPEQLQRLGDQLTLKLEAAAPLTGIRCLRPPSHPLRLPMRRRAYWRLLSHLSLNYLSLADSEDGLSALKEILRLYDYSDTQVDAQQASVNRLLVEGLSALSSRQVVGRVGPAATGGFATGVEVTITFDEKNYVGTGVFLVASVLERFLGQYVSINSFTQMVAKTVQGEEVLKKWPPQVGKQPLL